MNHHHASVEDAISFHHTPFPEDPDIEKNQYGKNIDTPEILVFLD